MGSHWHSHQSSPGACPHCVSSDSTSLCGRYDPDHVCNASDNAGRYTYSKQPQVCKWNLQKLAEALEPELPLALGEAILAEEFDSEFQRHYLQKMRKKLGLIRVEQEEDGTLVAKLLETMHLTGEPQNHHYGQIFSGIEDILISQTGIVSFKCSLSTSPNIYYSRDLSRICL